MSLHPSILRALAAAGATTDIILAAVEADAALHAERLARRRDGNRERQSRYREARNAGKALRGVTQRDGAAPSPDKSPPDPQKLTPNPCVRDARARAAAGRTGYHRLPEGWTPTRPLPPTTQAKADQWPPGAIEEELAALHRWAANAGGGAGKGRKLDWDKAWVTWIERRHDEHFRRTGSGAAGAARHQAPDGLSATSRAALRIFGSSEPGAEGSVPR
jgi:hypothetical protein